MTKDKSSARLIDLSHTVEHGMITYKGLPAPAISDFLSREDSRKVYGEGTEFHIGRIDMIANTGTYLDSPFHRYASGADLSALCLTSIANLDGIVVHHVRDAERECCFIRVGICVGAQTIMRTAIMFIWLPQLQNTSLTITWHSWGLIA